MYIRPYYEQKGREGGLPEGYGGTMLKEEPMPESPQTAPTVPKVTVAPQERREVRRSPQDEALSAPTPEENETPTFALSKIFQKGLGALPGLDMLPALFGGKLSDVAARESTDRKSREFGGEELLLTALAALLFFGKNGDRGCAMLLLLLLLF